MADSGQMAFDFGECFRVTDDRLLSGWGSRMRERGLSENTIDQRLQFMLNRDRELDLLTISREDLATWLGQHVGWTRRTYHNHFASYFEYLEENGHLDRNPIRGIRKPPEPKPRPRPLSQVQVADLFTAPSDLVHALMQLGRLAGFRVHEATKMHGRDITAERIYVEGKGGNVAMLPTHPELWRIAQDYPRDDWWFPSSQRVGHLSVNSVGQTIRKHFDDCGIEGSFHRLRATFGTDLLRAGHNIKVIQTLLRHGSLKSTEHYLGVLDSELTTAVHGLAA